MITPSVASNEVVQGNEFSDLRVLYPDEFQLLFSSAETITVLADQAVVSEGQQGTALYLVKSGQLLVSKQHEGNVYEVATITKGDIFGEASVLYQGKAGAEVRAVEDCELYVVPAETIHMLFDSNERFLRATTQLAESRAAASALAVNPIFSTLPMAVRQVALYNGKYIGVHQGDVIIHEGDEASFMFILLSGSVEVSLQHPNNPEEKIHVSTRYSGDELGEIALITGYPHGATVTALDPVRVLAISNLLVSAWSARHTDFAYSLYGQVYRKLKENRVTLNQVMDDKVARDLTTNTMPALEDFKEKNHL